jgi:hypothetical protein
MNCSIENDTVRRLNLRLTEAWQSLWDSFVDPRDAISDDGSDWSTLGSHVGAGGAASIPFGNEQELSEIRAQCRQLALGNEFAINGH